LVLDLDREERTIALHLLHVRDHEHVELEKAGVLATEDRVVRAFGSAAEIAALDVAPDARHRPAGRTTP
jgi:multicomponent Na+:H+ antiporter subunit E